MRVQFSFWYRSPASSVEGLFKITVLAFWFASLLSVVYAPHQYSMVFAFSVLYVFLVSLFWVIFSFWGLNFSHGLGLGRVFFYAWTRPAGLPSLLEPTLFNKWVFSKSPNPPHRAPRALSHHAPPKIINKNFRFMIFPFKIRNTSTNPNTNINTNTNTEILIQTQKFQIYNFPFQNYKHRYKS